MKKLLLFMTISFSQAEHQLTVYNDTNDRLVVGVHENGYDPAEGFLYANKRFTIFDLNPMESKVVSLGVWCADAAFVVRKDQADQVGVQQTDQQRERALKDSSTFTYLESEIHYCQDDLRISSDGKRYNISFVRVLRPSQNKYW